MEEVVDKLHLDMDYKELVRKIKVENPSDTRILNISALDPDAEMAKKIVDMTAKVASDYVGEIMEMTPPKLIESKPENQPEQYEKRANRRTDCRSDRVRIHYTDGYPE